MIKKIINISLVLMVLIGHTSFSQGNKIDLERKDFIQNYYYPESAMGKVFKYSSTISEYLYTHFYEDENFYYENTYDKEFNLLVRSKRQKNENYNIIEYIEFEHLKDGTTYAERVKYTESNLADAIMEYENKYFSSINQYFHIITHCVLSKVENLNYKFNDKEMPAIKLYFDVSINNLTASDNAYYQENTIYIYDLGFVAGEMFENGELINKLELVEIMDYEDFLKLKPE